MRLRIRGGGKCCCICRGNRLKPGAGLPIYYDMNPRMFQILTANPEKFPKQMLKNYSRVLERISEAWDTEQADAVFAELLVADNEHRQGFPPDVVREILALNMLHDQYKGQEIESDDPWAAEKDMDQEAARVFVEQLEQAGKPFAPETLFKAVEEGDTRLALDLTRAGINVDIRRADEWTPLMVALFNGQEEVAMMLLSRGANVRAKISRGYEPLHWAALNGYERAVKFILRKGGSVHAETDFGWTPLLQAATKGHANVARLLLDAGAAVNHAEQEGWTPLHKACANVHVDTVRLLVRRGADAYQRTQSGVTSMELALKHQNIDLMQALSEPRETRATDTFERKPQ